MLSLKSLLFGNQAFNSCCRVVFESESTRRRVMTRLTSILLGWSAFWFKEEDESSELIMRSGDDGKN